MLAAEFKTVKAVQGPLVIVSLPEGTTVKYEELCLITLPNGEKRRGKVLDASEKQALVQMFEGTAGIGTEESKVRFLGEVQKIGVSSQMLGRIFNGAGESIDNLADIIPEKHIEINGAPINPASRAFPNDFIETGISTIDVMNTLVRGQKLPIFSAAGLDHSRVATMIARNARVKDGSEFAIVFGAMGVTFEEAQYFKREFENSGAIENAVLFLNTATDPVVERIAIPRMALTTAEYLAFEKNKHVLVILTDMTNYAE
ncbi:MAG TPA: V-type ATP synthase subunit B, partial [Candidatus Gracilibacteria bacterium]|nr:V-type ATP synthase subunit B [Candidatus Gracilibacteria bacterium]